MGLLQYCHVWWVYYNTVETKPSHLFPWKIPPPEKNDGIRNSPAGNKRQKKESVEETLCGNVAAGRSIYF